jgi:tetratricopeptide (TPR) repeat protein/tRNA A-37 threonylcarbamoyl transferase component Bud32
MPDPIPPSSEAFSDPARTVKKLAPVPVEPEQLDSPTITETPPHPTDSSPELLAGGAATAGSSALEPPAAGAAGKPAGLFPTLLHAPAELPAKADAGGATVVAPRPSALSEVSAEGDRVPGYELLAELGRGAMGVVYRARDVRLNRLVALKMVLSGSRTGDEDRVRFLDEARAVARLQHPNVVQVFEVGEAGGTPFCALEFVSGGTLAGALRGEPQVPPSAAARARVLARAMAAVHAASLVHRDLKPANVLLGPDGTLKITDFGLAKRLDDPSGRTQAGQVMGTPSYMAPEQAVGDTARIGPGSDVWALGAILYEMLTGRPPFRGTGVWDTIALVLTADPVPVRRLQPGCPRDLETVCLKCLEKDQHKRYASAAELADDLERFLDGRPVLARRAGPIERTVKWARRSPLRAALAVAAVACAGLLATALVFRAESARRDADLTKRELDEVHRRADVRDRFDKLLAGAQQEAATARDTGAWDRVAQTLRSALQLAEGDPEALAGSPLKTSAADLLAQAEAALAAARLRDEALARVAALGDYRADAVFHLTLATGLGLEESRDRVQRAAAAGLALFGITIDGDGPPAVAPGVLTPDEVRLVAHRCYELLLLAAAALVQKVPDETDEARQGRVREALARLNRAERLLSEVRTRACHACRAECLTVLHRDDEAKVAAEAAKATAPVLAADYFLLGLECHCCDDFGRAVPALTAALRADPEHFGARYLLAACQLRQGQPQAARDGLTICLRQRPGLAWPLILRASAEMELARRGTGDFRAARRDLDAVLADPQDQTARYAALTNRGVLAMHRGEWDAAVADLSEAIRTNPDAVPAYINLALTHKQRAEHPPWPVGLLALAPAPAELTTLVAVRAVYRARALDEAVAVLDAGLGKLPKEARLYHERGQVHLLRGEPARTREDLVRAIALAPNVGRLSTFADDLLLLGQVLHDAREYAAAVHAYAVVLDPILTARLGAEQRALAARRMAYSLIALGRWSEALSALDVYLALNPVPDGRALPAERARQLADALRDRGLLQAAQKDLRGAADSYTRALAVVRDPEVLALRGWAYLGTGAAALAEQDFEEVLRVRPKDPDALLGRADARIRLGRAPEAAADADSALPKIPDVTDPKARVRLRCQAARVFAQLTVRDSDPVGAMARTAGQLRAALADVPPAERPGFWKDVVLADPTLARVSASPAVRAVAAEVGLGNR